MNWKQLSWNDRLNVWQMTFAAIGVCAAIVTAGLAYKLGVRQNELNETALKLNTFVELYLQPGAGSVLIQNVSTYPIYLNAYTLDGTRHEIGASALPNNTDAWYTLPLSHELEAKGKFELEIEFEDYLGKKYRSTGNGTWNGGGWSITSHKRTEG